MSDFTSIDTNRYGFAESGTNLTEPAMAILFNIDTSGSVSDEERRMIERYIAQFKSTVIEKGHAEQVDVAVVTFGSTTNVLVDWCTMPNLPEVHLPAQCDYELTDLNGGCLLGTKMLQERGHVFANRGQLVKKPYLITITDGYDCVSESVEEAADLIATRTDAGKLKHFFLGIGDYDRHAAAQLTRAQKCIVFECDGTSWSSGFFDFVANSVASASVSTPGEKLRSDPKRLEDTHVVQLLDELIN